MTNLMGISFLCSISSINLWGLFCHLDIFPLRKINAIFSILITHTTLLCKLWIICRQFELELQFQKLFSSSVWKWNSRSPVWSVGLLNFFLFVCNRGDTLECQDGLWRRKLCQSPMPDHCCNSGIIHGASPRCFPYTITWTEESTCNARHGIGIWSAERHWEADPTTAGHGHF